MGHHTYERQRKNKDNEVGDEVGYCECVLQYQCLDTFAVIDFVRKSRPEVIKVYPTREHLCKEERNSPGYNNRYHGEHDSIKMSAVIWSENPAVEEHEAQLDQAQSQDQHQLYCPEYLPSVSQRSGAACGFLPD